MDIQDSERAVFLERCRVVAELVQEDTQSPHVRLLVDRPPQIGIDHFGPTILEGGVSIEVGFEGPYFLGVGREPGCHQ